MSSLEWLEHNQIQLSAEQTTPDNQQDSINRRIFFPITRLSECLTNDLNVTFHPIFRSKFSPVLRWLIRLNQYTKIFFWMKFSCHWRVELSWLGWCKTNYLSEGTFIIDGARTKHNCFKPWGKVPPAWDFIDKHFSLLYSKSIAWSFCANSCFKLFLFRALNHNLFYCSIHPTLESFHNQKQKTGEGTQGNT